MDYWSNEQVLEFLDLYEVESIILWDPSNNLHKNRNKKNGKEHFIYKNKSKMKTKYYTQFYRFFHFNENNF